MLSLCLLHLFFSIRVETTLSQACGLWSRNLYLLLLIQPRRQLTSFNYIFKLFIRQLFRINGWHENGSIIALFIFRLRDLTLLVQGLIKVTVNLGPT